MDYEFVISNIFSGPEDVLCFSLSEALDTGVSSTAYFFSWNKIGSRLPELQWSICWLVALSALTAQYDLIQYLVH